MSFGSPHAYTGPDYPIDSPSLREGWTKGGSPLTGCSCVPEVDFGGGLVVGDRAPASRSGDGLPAGMHLEWEYEPGGVWVTCFAGTATFAAHDPDGNMTSDGTFAYSYDAENRLASVSSNGITLVVNQYDYRGRRSGGRI